MYTLLAKRPPFRGPTKTQILDDLQRQTPLPLGRLVFGLPEELEVIVTQLLEKDPEKRIATASILGRRLRALLHAHRQGKLLDTDPADSADVAEDDFDVGPVGQGSRPTEIGATQPEKTQVSPGDDATETPVTNVRADLPSAGETVIGASSKTEIAAGPKTSFTEIDGEQPSYQPRGGQAAETKEQSPFLAIAGIVLAAAALCGLAWWLSLPPDPNVVYQRIEAVAGAGDHAKWVDVRTDIDNFLRDYPEEERRDQVQAWREDHEWYKYWRQLERQAKRDGGLEFLPTKEEQSFVLAARQDNAGNREQAIEAYQALLNQREDGEAWQLHAGHRLKQLEAASP